VPPTLSTDPTIPMTTSFSNPLESLQLQALIRMLRFTREYKNRYIAMVSFLMLQMLSYSFLSYSLKILIEDIFPTRSIGLMLIFAASWVLSFAFHGWFTLTAARHRIFLVSTLVAKLRQEIIRKLQILSMRYFDKRGTGSTSAKVLMDMERLQEIYRWFMQEFLQAFIGAFMVIPFLLSISVPLTIITLLYIPLTPVIQRVFKKLLLKQSHQLRTSNENLSAQIVDFISGIRLIRVFGNESHHSERVLELIDNVRRDDIRYTNSIRILQMVIQFIAEFVPIIVWVSAGIMIVMGSQISEGAIVAYVALVGNLFGQFRLLFNSFEHIVRAAPSVKAVEELLENPETEYRNATGRRLHISGAVSFRDVSFRYNLEQEHKQLQNVFFDINPGERVAFVGHSGSGKSTTINAMMGLYPLDGGDILYDGYSINEMDLRHLRSQIAMMTQDIFMFNTTVFENLRFANVDADFEMVREACRKAEILEAIEQLPEGFDTFCGERGAQLSGGQRQRIGLARIFLRSPKIIILDEPTSALDPITERKVFDTLNQQIGEATLIVVAHRISTVKKMDRILVFENGKIMEEGHYQDLTNRPSLFAELAKEQ
jgi:ABC-type multidrug transport system fused ATPase/permease subunit